MALFVKCIPETSKYNAHKQPVSPFNHEDICISEEYTCTCVWRLVPYQIQKKEEEEANFSCWWIQKEEEKHKI